MTREELIHHIRYSIDINADIILTNDEGKEIIKALEQEPVLDEIRVELLAISEYDYIPTRNAMEIIDKYKGESEDKK